MACYFPPTSWSSPATKARHCMPGSTGTTRMPLRSGGSSAIVSAIHGIRLNITVTGEKDVAVRAFVSLSTDRAQGGGYRSIEAVMSSSDMMAVMLADALGELNVLRKKYAKLKALRPVWDAIERIESPPIRAAG